jgi:hypothetical protein
MSTDLTARQIANRTKKLSEKASTSPDELSDEEIDLFMSTIIAESDANIVKHYNPRT